MPLLIIIGVVLVLMVLKQDNKEKQLIIKESKLLSKKENLYEAEKKYYALLCERYLKNKHKGMVSFEFLTETYLTDQIVNVLIYFKDGSIKQDMFNCNCIHYPNSPKYHVENQDNEEKDDKKDVNKTNEADEWLKLHVIKIEECVEKAKSQGMGIYAYYPLKEVPGALEEILEKLNRNLDYEIKMDNNSLVINFDN